MAFATVLCRIARSRRGCRHNERTGTLSSYDYPQGPHGQQSYTSASSSGSHEFPPPHWPEAPSVTPRFRVGDALAVGGGVFVFLFSFLPFVSYTDALRGPIERSGFDVWFNAWEAQTFMAPLTWFVVLAGLSAAGLSVATYVLRRPISVLRFTAPQLQVITSLFAFLTLLGYATSAKSVVFGSNYAQYLGDKAFANGIDFAAGGYLMLVFALLCSVGAVMNLYDTGPTLFPRSAAARSPGTATASSRQ